MATTKPATKRVGLIATGSELVSGEILNVDGQKMAQAMLASGIELGEHLIVDDQQSNIERALQFMLAHHDAVITSGGLGPTADDITRFAIASVTGKACVYHDDSWQRIVERLSTRNLDIPESNKRQAYFPKDAIVYPNANGTADGCELSLPEDKLIFMLPGPPRECLPLFHNHVLPKLLAHHYGTDRRLYRWRLMGISEAMMAEQLHSRVAELYGIEIAYRASYPYLDVKLLLDDSATSKKVIQQVEATVAPYLVTTESSNISTQLAKALETFPHSITICDQATRGALEAQLVLPENRDHITFVQKPADLPKSLSVHITGLAEYWTPRPNTHTTHIQIKLQDDSEEQIIYLRGQETIDCAIEFISHQIYSRFIKPCQT